MKFWLINEARKMELITKDEEDSLIQSVRIKINKVSLNACDLAIFNAPNDCLPIIPCRIAVGLISESDDKTLRKGQRIMLSPYSRNENGKYSIYGKNIDGYLRDFVTVPTADIFHLPEGVSDDSITFVEDIAINIKAYEQLDIDKTQYVIINGAVASNLIFAQLCLYYQAIPIIIDNDNDRLSIAEQLGVYYCINTNEEDLLGKVKEITSGKMANYLVINSDCYSHNDDLLKCVKHSGKVAIIGFNTFIDDLKLNINSVLSHSLTIYGINDGIGELATAINMLATEIIKTDLLINKIVDFEEAKEIFINSANNQLCFKTIIKC